MPGAFFETRTPGDDSMLAGDMLRRAAERFPSKPAVLWQDQSISCGALDLAADRLPHALINAGVAKGEKVGMLCRNRIEYAIVFFGVARSGAVLVNISTLYQADELAYVLQKADVTTLFYEDVFQEKVDAVRGRPPMLKRFVRIGEAGGDLAFEAFHQNE